MSKFKVGDYVETSDGTAGEISEIIESWVGAEKIETHSIKGRWGGYEEKYLTLSEKPNQLTAIEAAKIYTEAKEKELKVQLSQILESIKKSASKGYLSISTQNLYDDAKEELEKLGYIVTAEPEGYKIAWVRRSPAYSAMFGDGAERSSPITNQEVLEIFRNSDKSFVKERVSWITESLRDGATKGLTYIDMYDEHRPDVVHALRGLGYKVTVRDDGDRKNSHIMRVQILFDV